MFKIETLRTIQDKESEHFQPKFLSTFKCKLFDLIVTIREKTNFELKTLNSHKRIYVRLRWFLIFAKQG